MVSSSLSDCSGSFVPILEHLCWKEAQGWNCLIAEGLQLQEGDQNLVSEHLFLQNMVVGPGGSSKGRTVRA